MTPTCSSRSTPASAARTALTGWADVPALARLYNELIDQLGLDDVTVISNSLGGWTAAEIALLRSPRVSGIVLIDAVGIDVPGHPVADFFSMTMDEVFTRAFHNPEPFRIDPGSLPPAARAVAAGNNASLAAYAGTHKSMSDPGLAGRLATVETPRWSCGGTATGSPIPTTGGPTPPPSPWPASGCSAAPATSRRWRPPASCWTRSGTASAKPPSSTSREFRGRTVRRRL
jgi:pimeloyl-ACP methyl ester carboxylesterase